MTVFVRGLRRTLWLGRVSRRAAESVARKVQELADCAALSESPTLETLKWAQSVDPRVGEKLAEWGLVASTTARTKLPSSLDGWLEHYISNRKYTSDRTENRHRQSKAKLIAFFAADKPLAMINAGDAEDFVRELYSQHAESTAAKHLNNSRMFFADAVKRGVLPANPFEGIKARGKADPTRKAYWDPKDCQRLCSKSNPEFALVIALARWGGLRTPSEMLVLEWSHVDWDASVMHVESPKTGLRHVPIFAAVRPYLDHWWDVSPDTDLVIPSYRSPDSAALTKPLRAACKQAGVQPKPKPWVNFRASCRTDLEGEFPSHVCDAWLGHSEAVAKEHYLQVTPEMMAQACEGVR